jgi:WD40 repeat protein
VAALRLRRREILWSLFGLALVGLGFLLQEWLSPWPRCTIPFKSSVSFAGISPDGRLLATGKTVTPFHAFLGGGLPQGAFPGFRLVKPGYVDNPIQVWDTRSGNQAGSYFNETGAWNHSFSPRFRYLAAWEGNPDAGQLDTFLHLVDLQTNEHKRLPLGGISSGTFLFSPRENFVLVFDEANKGNKIFHLVQTATGKVVSTFHGSAVHGFVPDESLIVYEAQNGDLIDVHVWNTQLQKLVHTMSGATEATVSRNGQTLAANTSKGWIFLDLSTLQTRPFDATDKSVQKALFSPDGKTLAIFCSGGKLEFWNVSTARQRSGECPLNPGSEVSYMFFSPDSSCLCLGLSNRGVFSVWDVTTATMLWSREMAGAVAGFEKPWGFTANGRFMATYQDGIVGGLQVLETRTGNTIQALATFEKFFCRFSNNDRWLTTWNRITPQPHLLKKLLGDWWPGGGKSTSQRVRTIDVSGVELACLVSESLEEGYHSEDGRTLVTKHEEKNQTILRVWDLPLRPPLRLVVGIPLGIGLFFVLLNWWRARKRAAKVSRQPIT